MARRRRRKMEVQSVKVEGSRRLVRVSAQHGWWKKARTGDPIGDCDAMDGAIVWLDPPHTAEDADVVMLKEHAKGLGAIGVKVTPRAPSPDAVASVTVATLTSSDMAEVVMAIASEVENVDQEALREALRESLAAEG